MVMAKSKRSRPPTLATHAVASGTRRWRRRQSAQSNYDCLLYTWSFPSACNIIHACPCTILQV